MGSVSEGPKAARFRFIARHRLRFGVRYLCQQLHVSPAGFYKWLQLQKTTRAVENRRLALVIRQLYAKHKGNYGSPRIHAALRRQGIMVNRKRVERLMREMGLVGKAAKLYRRKPAPTNPCITVGNQKRLECPPGRENQHWAGDVTYLKLNGEWVYLAVTLDLYSRRVVGWDLGPARTTELTTSALNKAIATRDVSPGMIFHSDRGSEYGAYSFQSTLKQAGIETSPNKVDT